MILNKATVKNTSNQTTRALSLLMEEMSVWYPAPYYDIKAMLSEEANAFKANNRAKAKVSGLAKKRSKSKKSLSGLHTLAV